jgi:hypothetical protein
MIEIVGSFICILISRTKKSPPPQNDGARGLMHYG